MSVHGSCHCGGVKFSITSQIRGFRHCHCHTCRKINGTAFASSALTERSGLVFTQGENNLTPHVSSAGKTRYFCSRCGSHIYAHLDEDPRHVILRVGTLDNLPNLPLQAHIWVDHKVPWYEIPTNAPHYPQGLPDMT